MGTEQKYPEHLVETIAKALFAGYGANGYHLDAHYRIEAVKVLDALGLTVTEEWGMTHPRHGSLYVGYDDEAHVRHDRGRNDYMQTWPIVHRTVLHAETPWVEVSPDAE